MDTIETPVTTKQDRRQLLGTAAMGIANSGAASLPPIHVAATPAGNSIRPFGGVNIPEEALVDLRRRIAATRWPERETVTDASQGVQLDTIQALARYWATEYDWRKIETKIKPCPSSSPKSTGWTSTSFTFAQNTKMPCR